MRIILLATTLTFLIPTALAETVKIEDRTFTLPPGFTIERVVAPPVALRPVTIDFDERGRLYVADSSGSSAKPDQQLKDRPHRVLRLEDTNNDGVFDKQTVFADKMMFLQGTMWLDGSLYVAAPPSIWKLTDTDDDGVADQRVEWFNGKTLTGCANDLHGPYAGPDGWIYWTKGAFAKQTYTLPNGKEFTTRAAHIFRARPDGTGIEPVMTGGMDNPVDVAFTAAGERIFTTTFLQNPAGGKRDGLIHAIYGGVYGKVHDVIEGHIRTSPELMPVLSHLGPAAPSGLHSYESAAFGPEYENNLFTACFNLRKVVRHVLTPDGATFKSKDEDFVVCDHVDFHPTDVIEDADGSLLIVDTGGWYKLCCPTSQLVKPDILGAVYRVRRTDAKKIEDPRGLKVAWEKATPDDLAKLLDDDRPAVRRRAIATLAKQGATPSPKAANNAGSANGGTAVGEGGVEGQNRATATLRAVNGALRTSSPRARLNAVWAASRLPGPDARATVRGALTDRDSTVVQAACHVASVARDPLAAPDLVKLVSHDSLQVRRAAAEALGRVGDHQVVPRLLAALETASADRTLEHALMYALVQIGSTPDRDKDYLAVATDAVNHAAKRRAAVVVLDQTNSPLLASLPPDEAEPVVALLRSSDGSLRDTAAWVVSRRPGWGGALAAQYRELLIAPPQPGEDPEDLHRQVAALSRSPDIQRLLADLVSQPTLDITVRRTVAEIMSQAPLSQLPDAWRPILLNLLAGHDGKLADAAATAFRRMGPKRPSAELIAALLKLAARTTVLPDTRLNALATLPPAGVKEAAEVPALSQDLFTFVSARLSDPHVSAQTRLRAAETLARSSVPRDLLLSLARAVEITGPLELDRVLPTFAQDTADDAVGNALLDSLERSKSLTSLRPDTVAKTFKRFGPDVQKRAQPILARLAPDAANQTARLDALQKSLPAGDVRRGQLVFNSAKAACASCHAIGYVGGKLGPDLTKIGAIRQERDLLESVLFPSASFAQSFEPTIVETADGDTHGGILRKNDAAEVVLGTGPDLDVRIARKDVKSMRPGTLSMMPAGLDQQLTPQELADLVAFLRACK